MFPDYPDDVEVLGELFATVGRLAVRDEFCLQVHKLDGLKNIIAALQVNVANQVWTIIYCTRFFFKLFSFSNFLSQKETKFSTNVQNLTANTSLSPSFDICPRL